MLKRLTAMCLLVLTVMSSIPITALGAGVNADINAGGGGITSGIIASGGGTMSEDNTGYRFYLVDKDTGKRVSRVVDLTFDQPYGSTLLNATKFDSGLTIPDSEYMFASVQSVVNAMNSSLAKRGSTIKFGLPTYPVVYNGYQFVGKGNQFKSWLMGGLDTTLGTGVDVDTSSGYQFQPGRGQEFPPENNGEPVTSTEVYSTLEAIALNYLDILYQLPHSEYNMSQYSAKAASGSTLQHLTNFINQAAAQNSLNPKQVQVVIA